MGQLRGSFHGIIKMFVDAECCRSKRGVSNKPKKKRREGGGVRIPFFLLTTVYANAESKYTGSFKGVIGVY